MNHHPLPDTLKNPVAGLKTGVHDYARHPVNGTGVFTDGTLTLCRLFCRGCMAWIALIRFGIPWFQGWGLGARGKDQGTKGLGTTDQKVMREADARVRGGWVSFHLRNSTSRV